MNKSTLTMLAALLAAPMYAQVAPLGGFYYGQMPQPSGWEWQSPDSVAYNKQQPHAWFFSFANSDEARRVLPENSSLWQTLDGEWNFIGPRTQMNVLRISSAPILMPQHGTVYRCL